MSIWVFNEPPATFIRIRKTGSTSIVKGIFKRRGEQHTLENCTFQPEWRSGLVFTFVRNPFDRLVSCLQMFQNYPVKSKAERCLREQLDLRSIIEIAENDDISLFENNFISKLRLHAVPMTHWSYCIHEAKFVGRFENFDADCETVLELLEIPIPDSIPHLRKSQSRDYRMYFTSDSRSKAESVFAEDLKTFEYRF